MLFLWLWLLIKIWRWILPLHKGVYGLGSCRFTQGHVYCMQGSSSRIMDALWPKDSQGREGIFKHTTTFTIHWELCGGSCALTEVEDYLCNYLRKGLCCTVINDHNDLTNPLRAQIIQCLGHDRCFHREAVFFFQCGDDKALVLILSSLSNLWRPLFVFLSYRPFFHHILPIITPATRKF